MRPVDLTKTGDLQACSTCESGAVWPLGLFAICGWTRLPATVGPEYLLWEASSHTLNRFCHQSSPSKYVRVGVPQVCRRIEFFGEDLVLKFPG